MAAARSDTVRPPLGQSFAAQPEKVKAQTNPVKLAYTIAGAIVVLGWAATRNYELVDPVTGTGYWLGIVGASLMALLLLYPVRKRIRLFRFFGPTRHWFRAHMVLGVVGPLLILYHCNFSFGSVNSTVALVCTLLVAGSGLVGRYLHAKVYASLDGHRRSISELIERAKVSQEQQRHVTVLVPDLISRMSAFDAVVMSPPEGFWQTVLLPAKLGVTTRIGYWRLNRYARRCIAERAAQSDVIRAQRRRLRQATSLFIARHLRRIRRAAELGSYERLFSLWHVFHLPFFYMLVVSALIHVLAVHMY